ncbi:family 1 glycosylhydrolase [Streptomyces sp. NPDC004284]|uniref:family 1 glycosylhydrolase n=1 Tax=Streptomyces sp. NPDC004284 TaxID=3364695 RepID=UPI003688D931
MRLTAATVPGTPPIVTGNGIATADGDRGIAYTAGAPTGLAHAMADGVDVRGCFHWRALDNCERGSYRTTFGLITVDRKAFVRTPEPSGARLGAIGRRLVLPTASS